MCISLFLSLTHPRHLLLGLLSLAIFRRTQFKRRMETTVYLKSEIFRPARFDLFKRRDNLTSRSTSKSKLPDLVRITYRASCRFPNNSTCTSPLNSRRSTSSDKSSVIVYAKTEHLVAAVVEEKQHFPDIESFYLPELSCYFPATYHPDYLSIREEVNSWLLEWKCPKSEEEKAMLVQSDFAGMICMMVPESIYRQRVLLLCKFVAWLSCYDDVTDKLEKSGTDAGAINEINQGIEEVLDRSSVPNKNQEQSLSMKAISSVLREMSADMTPGIYKRHVSTLKKSLSTVAKQADLREGCDVLPLASYIANRRRTFAFDHIQVTVEHCLGIELRKEILDSNVMKELHDAVADYISWTNDVLSFRSEYFEGDLQNLLPVLYFEHGGKLNFNQVVKEACKMIYAREREFVQLMHQLTLSQQAVENPELRRYLHNLPNLLAGFLEWYYTSARFHGINHGIGKVREGTLMMQRERTVLLPV